MHTTTAPSRVTLWTLTADPGSPRYYQAKHDTETWLAANGVNPADLVPASTITIIGVGPLVYLATWNADRNLDGTTVPCPSCQGCVRGHEAITLLTAPMPATVAQAGWPDADAPKGWYDAIRQAAGDQAHHPDAHRPAATR